MKINIYGDSIMKGAVLEPSGRYRAVMGESVDAVESAFGVSIRNRSRFGSTVTRGFELVERDIAQGIDCRYALVEFGGNDCNFHWDEVARAPQAHHDPLTALDRFAETYRAMLLRLQGAGVRPVAMTLPPIDAQVYLDHIGRTADKGRVLEWLGDAQMIYRFHELYSATVAGVARDVGAVLIDVRARFLGEHGFSRLIGADGIHLNAEGYRRLARILSDFLAAGVGMALQPG